MRMKPTTTGAKMMPATRSIIPAVVNLRPPGKTRMEWQNGHAMSCEIESFPLAELKQAGQRCCPSRSRNVANMPATTLPQCSQLVFSAILRAKLHNLGQIRHLEARAQAREAALVATKKPRPPSAAIQSSRRMEYVWWLINPLAVPGWRCHRRLCYREQNFKLSRMLHS